MRCGRPGAALILAALVLLAACGSDLHVRLYVAIDAPAPPVRTREPVIFLGGLAALPAGSLRAAGTAAHPAVTCQPGAFAMFWTNDANGTRGTAFASWNCAADELGWRTSAIPLAPGANPVSVTIVDDRGSATSSVVVVRD